jgi:gliding motility-associated-like protein
LRKTFPEGIQQIVLVVKTAEGCISEPFVKTFNITAKPSTSISVQDACYGDPVLMNAGYLTPDIPIRQWYWSTGDGEVDSGASITHYYAGGGLYPVGVYALNYAGCSSDTVTAMVTIYQTWAHTGNDTIVAFGQPLQLNATGGDFYQWIPGDGLNNPNIADPVAVLYKDMRYIVKVYTTFGCPTYDTILIKAYKGPAFYVPNAFTPDNNGINDRFHPIAVGMSSIDNFEIYNRLGQKIYSSSGNSPGWDGTFDGKPQPIGSYVWIIRGQDYQGKQYHEKGTVVLIR